MRCNQFEHLLHGWVDGALAPDEAMAVRAHADACPICADLATTLREALALCGGMGDEADVPQAAAMAWRRAVRTEAAGSRVRRFALPRWEAWAGLAAGILVLIGGANMVRLGRMSLQPNNAALVDYAPAPVVMEQAMEPAYEAVVFDAAPEMADAEMKEPQAPHAFASRAADLMPSEALSEADAFWEDADADDGEYIVMESSEPFAAFEAFEPEAEGGAIPIEWPEPTPAKDEAPASFNLLAFLRDGAIFLALCMPPAAIALCIVRLCNRGKKARKPSQP